MKKICLFGFLLLILTACADNKEKHCTIFGEIQGLGNDTLYLYGIDKYFDRIDTIPVNDGKFSATIQVDTLLEARLLFSNRISYPIYLDKDNAIEIKGAESDLSFLNVKGNKPNTELTNYQKELKEMAAPSESALEEKAKAFIETHPFSLVSIYLLDKYFVQKPSPNFEQIQKLTDGMSGELKDRPYITKLQEAIKANEKAKIGNNFPYFRLPNAKGKKITRSDFKSKYLLVHFWAAWDTLSCKQNATYRHIYQKEKKNKNFALLGISLDLDKEKWEQCIQRDSLEWEQLCDFNGWHTELVKQLGINVLPYNLLLSPTGRIEAKDLDEKAIENRLRIIEKESKEKEKKAKEKKRMNQ